MKTNYENKAVGDAENQRRAGKLKRHAPNWRDYEEQATKDMVHGRPDSDEEISEEPIVNTDIERLDSDAPKPGRITFMYKGVSIEDFEVVG